ncbi:MAG: histidine kinase, partial [Marinobacter alexandrii]
MLFQSPLRADPPQPSPAPILSHEELTWLGEQGSFRVGVNIGQVPLIFDTGDGTLAGTFIDYLARLSGKLGVPIEPVTLGQGNEPAELATDAVLTTRLPDAQVTPGKRYSEPLMSLTYGLFVSAGDVAIRSLSDLEGG